MNNNIDEILQLSKEDLYEHIKADDEIDIDIPLEELADIGLDENLGDKVERDLLYRAKISLPDLASKKSLRKNWYKVRFAICTIYKENPKIGEKDLITAVIAALGVVGNWPVALIALALKLGLDKICAIYK